MRDQSHSTRLRFEGNPALPAVDRVAEFRRLLGVDFHIRGTSTAFAVDNSTTERTWTDTDGLPAYRVNPRWDIDSKEWVSRLHATIHAASGRTMEHSMIGLEAIREDSDQSLPMLIVFGPSVLSPVPQGACPIQAIKDYKRLLKGLRGSREVKPDEYSPRRESLEFGTVHGQRRPTFPESNIPGSSGSPKYFKGFKSPFLFDVRLTPKVHNAIIDEIEAKLQKLHFLNIKEFEGFYRGTSAINQRALNAMVVESVSLKEFQHAKETTSFLHTPADYLYFLSVARVLTDGFVAEGLVFAERLNEH